MAKCKVWPFFLACVLPALGACAGGAAERASDPRTVAAGLACSQLDERGARRPFADGSSGVVVRELHVCDFTPFDPDDWELRPTDPVGVRYGVAATPDSSRAWLERQIYCYRAARPVAATSDPLLVLNADVKVRSGPGRYIVDVTSDDPGVVREILSAAAQRRSR
ncbi:MAG: hypothetical protein JXQ73_21975 [Phycisphaerae bacterium]|nr:hypothetical protein [Phycisphaerae bacterium]